MFREIGSEYHRMPSESSQGLIFPRAGSLVFSGRTAIEAVLKKLPEAKTALLPSYCCESMIIPFIRAGIDIRFYQVEWDDGLRYKLDETADILLWCNYFGFKNEIPVFDGVIIEDITHSMLSVISSHSQSDYLVASLRKWVPVNCGGYCSVKMDGKSPSNEFVQLKTRAMELKAEYLKNPQQEKKSIYLSMFEKSNHWLAEHYSGLSIDPWSRDFISHIDIAKCREQRRHNASILYRGLKGRVQFMFPEQDMDCPLFIPVLFHDRDRVRKHLIENDIYCPVHWPKPEGCISNLYDMELSLICDQRYGSEEMQRIVSVIQEVL